MTAEEFYLKDNNIDKVCNWKVKEKMIEFAKYHVEQALKAASENVIIDGNKHEYELDKESILNAYPLDLIK